MAQYKVTFAYIKGRWYSFPSVESARAAVNKYTGNMDSVTYKKPSGVAINTTLGWSTDGEFADMNQWPDQVFAPEGVTGDALFNPPNNPITVGTTIPVDDIAGDDDTVVGGDDDQVIDEEPVDVLLDDEVDLLDWSGLDQDLVNLAKRYATAGMMGRAQAAFVKAGGTWNDAIHTALKEGAETKGYGGTIKFDWASLGVDAVKLKEIKRLAKLGKYGQISQLMEDEEGNTTFNKDVHQKLQAFVHMDKRTWDPTKGQVDDGSDIIDEVPEDEVVVDKPHVYDRTKMTGTKEQIKGKFKTGTARQDAQTWRQQHMDAAKKLYGDDPSKMSKINKDAWIKKRNAIANRHRIMIGAGKKTLKSGVVIGEDV